MAIKSEPKNKYEKAIKAGMLAERERIARGESRPVVTPAKHTPPVRTSKK